MQKIKVGVLGATGAVGQRFIQLLDNHPWFEVSELGASERSAGRSYIDAVEGRWKVSANIPKKIAEMKVKECRAKDFGCQLVFGALDSSVAGSIEEEFAAAGFGVISNSKNHRLDEDVPLVIGEVNPEHLQMIEAQKKNRCWSGFIVTNSNCTAMPLTITLKPLLDKFGISRVSCVSMQAISGAGYPGVASLDIVDNVVPFISGEEEKVEKEPLKMLGKLQDNKVIFPDMKISAHCNRVTVRDGHTECISVELKKKPSLEEFKNALRNFSGEPQELKLPMAPEKPIIIREEQDRPQPALDKDEGRGMATVVGRIREDPLFHYKFVLLSHNTIRGAAGAAILNAELLKAKKFI